MASTESIKCPEGRIVFENLLQPGEKTSSKSDKPVPYWDVTVAWPKSTDIAALRKLVVDAATAEWGDKAVEQLKNGTIKSPLLDGDGPQACNKTTGDRYNGYEGTWFVRAGTYQKPKMFTKNMDPVTERDELYKGVHVYPVLNAYTWAHPTNGRGVSIGLSMVQVLGRGERLGGSGGGDPSQFFEKIADEGEAPAAAKAGDGAAALFG